MARRMLPDVPGARSPGAVSRAVLPLVLLCTLAFAGEERDPYTHFFIQTFGDLPEEMATARADGKLGMLLFFEADACSYCQHMREKVLNQKKVQDWFGKRFVNIAVDIHGDVELTDFDGITLPSKVFAEHRRVYLTPVTAFIDLHGNEIYRHLGMVKTPEEFLLLGEYVAGEHYTDTEFRVFADRRGLAEGEDVLATPAGDTE
jgi:thioredoxin-related protein